MSSPKPTALPLLAENIPPTLRAIAAWVGWRFALDKAGRWTKQPRNIRSGGGGLASSTNSETWCDFDTACRNYKAAGCDGIGLCLTGDFLFVDLDRVLDAGGNLLPFPWAQRILRAIAGRAYVEKSVSGSGLHGIVLGARGLPPGRREWEVAGQEHVGFALYTTGRYFTFSGHLFPESGEICDLAAEMPALYADLFPTKAAAEPEKGLGAAASSASLSDAELLDRALKSPKFSALWHGDFSEYPSQSEADAAFCALLAFWTRRDPGRIDSLYRQSALMRPKWERKDYREKTIRYGCESATEVWTPRSVSNGHPVMAPNVGEPPELAAAGDPGPSLDEYAGASGRGPDAAVDLNECAAEARRNLGQDRPVKEWRDRLIRSKDRNGKLEPRAILANAVTAFRYAPEWYGVLGFNEFSLSTVALKPAPWARDSPAAVVIWSDHEDRLAADWLQHQGIFVSVEIAGQAVQVVAKERPFHPVRDYMDSLKWDGVKRLDDWPNLYLGAETTDYVRAVGARWMISAQARLWQPGAKVDCCFILEGEQGIKKSTALRVLAGEWFTDELADLGSKDAALQTMGVWIIEISELDAMTKADVSKIKAFMSRSADRFRPPYGKRLIEAPRQCVFSGSVNRSDYLRDETGGRRFWPIRCGRILIDELARDRDQLWAEALVRYRAGDRWWLDTPELNQRAALEQADRLEGDVWDALLLEWAQDRLAAGNDSVSVGEALDLCLHKKAAEWTRADEMRVGRSLRAAGWVKYRDRSRGMEWRYRGPEPLKATVPTSEVGTGSRNTVTC